MGGIIGERISITAEEKEPVRELSRNMNSDPKMVCFRATIARVIGEARVGDRRSASQCFVYVSGSKEAVGIYNRFAKTPRHWRGDEGEERLQSSAACQSEADVNLELQKNRGFSSHGSL